MSLQKSVAGDFRKELELVGEAANDGAVALARDYFQLLKPRIIVLLLISTGCPMILAADGVVKPSLIFWGLLGGALVSGSASVLNCIWDKDIDALMSRTRNRPLPA